MSPKNWQILTIVCGVVTIIALGFTILFGVKLSAAAKDKKNEISQNLAKQQKLLEQQCQAFKEILTTTYTADQVFGQFSFDYPKVWSTAVTRSIASDSNQSLTFLADPELIVLDNNDFTKAYKALRIQVIPKKYVEYEADIEKKYTGAKAKEKFDMEEVYVSQIKGASFTGKYKDRDVTIRYILVPIRDKTLYIGTDDFDKFNTNLETIIQSFKIIK